MMVEQVTALDKVLYTTKQNHLTKQITYLAVDLIAHGFSGSLKLEAMLMIDLLALVINTMVTTIKNTTQWSRKHAQSRVAGPPIQVVGVALITEVCDHNYSFVEVAF